MVFSVLALLNDAFAIICCIRISWMTLAWHYIQNWTFNIIIFQAQLVFVGWIFEYWHVLTHRQHILTFNTSPRNIIQKIIFLTVIMYKWIINIRVFGEHFHFHSGCHIPFKFHFNLRFHFRTQIRVNFILFKS